MANERERTILNKVSKDFCRRLWLATSISEAQWVEHLIGEQKVLGSAPARDSEILPSFPCSWQIKNPGYWHNLFLYTYTVGTRNCSFVLHWKKSEPSTTERWESSFPFQTTSVVLERTAASIQSRLIKTLQASPQSTRRPRIFLNVCWKCRISSRTGWCWGQWIWRSWLTLICRLFLTGRETSEPWKGKDERLRNCLCELKIVFYYMNFRELQGFLFTVKTWCLHMWR